MRAPRLRVLAAAAGLALLAGCVGMEDYERKSDEASRLRSELDSARGRAASLERTLEELRQKVEQRRIEGEELSQSLTMARRHSQQVQTGVADLRARISGLEGESRRLREDAARLKKENEAARVRARKTEAGLLDARKRLARFEDKLRFQMQLEKDFSAQFAAEVRAGTLKVLREGDRVVLRISSGILFAPGHAEIKTRGKRLLVSLAKVLRRYTNREVQVQGHTDNIPISERLAERWETNWELSASRATRVLRYLVEVGNLDPRRASAAGRGEFQPIADNASKAGRARNRRIEVVIFPPES